ncbi:MAG: OmpW family protein [Pseudorhodoplanes sp.]|nr:MAG: OmpW family protein [Pseudorhodoplanes sp.]
MLPPTLTFQCHFTNFGPFTASVGAGVNYTMFPNQSPGNTPNNGLTITSLKFHDTFSAAFQVGFDYMIDRHRGFNVMSKYYLCAPTSMPRPTTAPSRRPRRPGAIRGSKAPD